MKYKILILLFSFSYLKAEEFPEIACSNTYTNTVYEPIGILTGVNKSNLKHNINNLSTNSNYGLNIGLQHYLMFGDIGRSYSGIKSRISYVSNSIKYNISNLMNDNDLLKLNENNKYIQISSMYNSYFLGISSLNLFCYFSIGPYVNYNIQDKDFANSTLFDSNSFNTFEVGGNIGVGIELKYDYFKIGIEYNYLYAFTDKYSYKNNNMKNKSHYINFIFTPKKLF